MKMFRLKRERSRVHHTRRYPLYAALAALLAALIGVTVLSVIQSRTASHLEVSRENLVSSVQSELYGLVRTYEKSLLPTSDLEEEILPALYQHLYAARVTNRLAQDSYGETVVGEQMLDQIQAAVDQIKHLNELGQSITPARNVLGSCLTQMETELSAKYAQGDVFLSRTALK